MPSRNRSKPKIIYCSLCNAPSPFVIRLKKIREWDYVICGNCSTSDIPKADYEIVAVEFPYMSHEWKKCNIEIPDLEALESVERAKNILHEAKKLADNWN